MSEMEIITRFEINENWLNTRYRKSKKKHITPALELKESRGIARDNLQEDTTTYHPRNTDAYKGGTSYYEMTRHLHKKKAKKKHY